MFSNSSSCVFSESVCEHVCGVRWITFAWLKGRCPTKKSKTLVGLERSGWTREDEREKTMDNRVVAVLNRLRFLPGSESATDHKKRG